MKNIFVGYVINPILNKKIYIVMVLIQFVYAGMALFSKAAISTGMNPFVFVVYRQALASIALAPFAFLLESNKEAPLSYTLLCKVFFVSFFGLTLSLNLYIIALKYTTATFAAATTNTIPAVTFIIAVLLRMESITIKHVTGIAKVVGSVTGVGGALVFAFVKGPPLMNWDTDYKDIIDHHYHRDHIERSISTQTCCTTLEWIKGPLIMFFATVLWSLWFVLQGPIIKQYPSKLRLTALQCFFSCIQSAFWAIAAEGRNPSAWKLGWDINLLSVFYCGIVVNGIVYWLQAWAIEKKGPVFTSMFTPLALIITAIFSAFLWKETLHWGSVGGAIVLVSGLYGVLWGKNKEAEIDVTKSITITNLISDEENNVVEENKANTLECITTTTSTTHSPS